MVTDEAARYPYPVVDFEELPTSSITGEFAHSSYRDVRAFCTCGWEYTGKDRLGAWAMGEIHLGRHLYHNEPATLQMADGPRTFYTLEEFKAERQR